MRMGDEWRAGAPSPQNQSVGEPWGRFAQPAVPPEIIMPQLSFEIERLNWGDGLAAPVQQQFKHAQLRAEMKTATPLSQ
ncbi:unnamed protein product [Urochloa humidicola]